MSSLKTVAIVGVGLIGGSIGLALNRGRLAEQVVGISRRRSTLDAALSAGAISRAADSLEEGVQDADLVVVCTPVQTIPTYVQQSRRHCPADAVVTDAGSTKETIVSRIAELQQPADRGTFVGSHPLAGSDRSGVQHARADLLDDRVVVVTPAEGCPESAVLRVEAFWQRMGARTRRLTARAHDEALAVTSHLPHVVAAALAAVTEPDYLELTASGWSDTTRIAAANPELWQQILLTNQPHALQALDNFGKVLADFRRALEQGDSRVLLELLQTGKDRRDAVGN